MRKPRTLAGSTRPFTTRAFHWPLNLGIQQPFWQAGGPSGFADGTAGAVMPWPYLTAFKTFISGFPYGVASSLVTNSGVANNLGAGYAAFLPIGIVKSQTHSQVSF